MSGRLIILPKKTYCPWRPENVERVLRDEQRERQRLEQLSQNQKELESRQRMLQLQQGTGGELKEEEQQHVNLFQEEERAMNIGTAATKHQQKSKPSVGVMPVRLDSVVQKNRDEPFYKRQSRQGTHEEKRAAMDPMKAFTKRNEATRSSHDEKDIAASSKRKRRDNKGDRDDEKSRTSSRKGRRRRHYSRYDEDASSDSEDSSTARKKCSRKRRHKKKQRKHSSKSTGKACSSKGDFIEELRRRRQEREQAESQREAALRHQGGSRNDSRRRYQDQFNPSLSRR